MIPTSSHRTMVETPDLKYRFFVTHRALVLARDYVFEALALAVVS
jgi:hypothetical protein